MAGPRRPVQWLTILAAQRRVRPLRGRTPGACAADDAWHGAGPEANGHREARRHGEGGSSDRCPSANGLRITVQDWPRRSLWLLSGQGCTLIDAAVRRYMRLRMRLTQPRAGRACAPKGRGMPAGAIVRWLLASQEVRLGKHQVARTAGGDLRQRSPRNAQPESLPRSAGSTPDRR